MFNKLLTDRNTVKNAKRVPRPGKMCVVRFSLDSYMLARGAEQLEFKMILFLLFFSSSSLIYTFGVVTLMDTFRHLGVNMYYSSSFRLT